MGPPGRQLTAGVAPTARNVRRWYDRTVTRIPGHRGLSGHLAVRQGLPRRHLARDEKIRPARGRLGRGFRPTRDLRGDRATSTEAQKQRTVINDNWIRRHTPGNYNDLESRFVPAAAHELDALLRRAQIELEPVTPEQAQTARQSWRTFGKGNHPAELNFGDLFAYALAKATREPILFKACDFKLTDIPAA